MTVYLYKNIETGAIVEVDHPVDEPPADLAGKFKRIYTAPGVAYKGEGFTQSTDPLYDHKGNQ